MLRETDESRTVFRIGGSDRADFLQGLVTNDVGRLSGGLVYSALLSPQGKYLSDFFLVPSDEAILLDVKSELAGATSKRLTLYRLRADVQIEETGFKVSRGLGDGPRESFPDPRHPALGWRRYEEAYDGNDVNWNAIRVEHCVPETGIELIPDETYILEAGFERLNGVDFRKGCFVGQEIVARMKHKTELRKGLARVSVNGSVPIGTPVLANGKLAGTLYSQSGGRGLAHLRFDRAHGEMQAGDADVRLID